MDTSKKNFRKDRSCESCGNEGAALVSEDIDAVPHYLCEPCMKFKLNRRMTAEEIVKLVEAHWKIEADGIVDKCERCGFDRITVRSIDGERFLIKCGCGTREGFERKRFFRIR